MRAQSQRRNGSHERLDALLYALVCLAKRDGCISIAVHRCKLEDEFAGPRVDHGQAKSDMIRERCVSRDEHAVRIAYVREVRQVLAHLRVRQRAWLVLSVRSTTHLRDRVEVVDHLELVCRQQGVRLEMLVLWSRLVESPPRRFATTTLLRRVLSLGGLSRERVDVLWVLRVDVLCDLAHGIAELEKADPGQSARASIALGTPDRADPPAALRRLHQEPDKQEADERRERDGQERNDQERHGA